MQGALRDHVWHADRTREEQQAFRAHVQGLTRHFVRIATLAAIGISIVSWPIDFVTFRARGSAALLWHVTEWRLIVVGWALGLLGAIRLFRAHVILSLSILSLVAMMLLGYSVGKIGPLHTNFLYTFYLLPQLTVLVFVPIGQRALVTFAVPAATLGAYLMTDRAFVSNVYLSTVIAVLVASSVLSVLIGHLFYDVVRVSYFRGRELEQERIVSERLLRRVVEHTNAELKRQIAARSQDVGDALARLAQQPREPIEAGAVIDGRYRVERWLGSGGVGAIHEVTRLADGCAFALKTLAGAVDPAAMARFAREAEVSARLNHPNLVPITDFGVTDGRLFIVMELVDGGSLEDQHLRFGRLGWALRPLGELAAGLAAMHGAGIVHRDLKPANVLMTKAGTVKIADFGLASLHEGRDADLAAGRLTHAGEVFGTFDYMAPELSMGARASTPACDIFAFGVIAHELAYARKPFPEPPILLTLANQSIPAPTLVGPLAPLIARCLDVDPVARPTANMLVATLRSIRISDDEPTVVSVERDTVGSRARPRRA